MTRLEGRDRPRSWRAGAGALTLILAGLCGCDNAPSAYAARAHTAGDLSQAANRGFDRGYGDDGGAQRTSYAAAAAPQARADGSRYVAANPDADTPRYHDKPVWAANKTHSGEDNAAYHFKRDGADFGATSQDDFIAKVHAFIDSPPKGSETLTRSNGDTLIYDPASNVFAVVAKDGAPRTLFKPRTGAAYWAQQKATLDQPFSSRAQRASTRGADDNG